MVRIRCHFDGRALVPDEPVDLPRNRSLVAHIEALSEERQDLGGDGTKPFFEWASKNLIDDPMLPDDLSQNLDHYLYGAPKRKE